MCFSVGDGKLTVGNEETSFGAEEPPGDSQATANERDAQLIVEDLALVLAVAAEGGGQLADGVVGRPEGASVEKRVGAVARDQPRHSLLNGLVILNLQSWKGRKGWMSVLQGSFVSFSGTQCPDSIDQKIRPMEDWKKINV